MGEINEMNLRMDNPFDFAIDWEGVYKQTAGKRDKLQKARDTIDKKRVPSEKLKDKIVYEIVSQVNEKWPLATRHSMETVYALMLAQHNDFFKERLKPAGYRGTWLYKLKNRLDNSRRPENEVQTADASKSRYERGPGTKSSYGCKKWRVRDLPEGQTKDTQEEHKDWLKNEYSETPFKEWNWREISDRMKLTYKSQRDLINENIEKAIQEAKEKRKKQRSKKRKRAEEQEQEEQVDDVQAPKVTIEKINEEWPFLFQYKGMLDHFNALTERDIEADFLAFQNNTQSDLFEFFDRQDNENYNNIINKMKAAEEKHPAQNQKLKALVLIVAKYFDEDPIIDLKEKTLTLDDLRETGPQYPGLAALGPNIFKAKKFIFGLDSRNYISLSNFQRAFLMLFMSFYVFNIDYPPQGQVTMEFFQRYVFGIDLPTGNKRPKKEPGVDAHFSSNVVHPKIGRFTIAFEAVRAKRRRIAEAGSDSEGSL